MLNVRKDAQVMLVEGRIANAFGAFGTVSRFLFTNLQNDKKAFTPFGNERHSENSRGKSYFLTRENFFWNFSTRPAVSTKRFSPV